MITSSTAERIASVIARKSSAPPLRANTSHDQNSVADLAELFGGDLKALPGLVEALEEPTGSVNAMNRAALDTRRDRGNEHEVFARQFAQRVEVAPFPD